jgi:hypothetical protein
MMGIIKQKLGINNIRHRQHSAIQELSRKNDSNVVNMESLEENQILADQRYSALEQENITVNQQLSTMKLEIDLIKQKLGINNINK